MGFPLIEQMTAQLWDSNYILKTLFIISKTRSNCPVYKPIVRAVSPDKSKREPMILFSEDSMNNFSFFTNVSTLLKDVFPSFFLRAPIPSISCLD